MHDLIMGLGNLPFAFMERFLGSLQDIGFRGDICLFCYNVDLAAIGALRSHGVIVVNGRGFVRSGRHLMCSRHFMYLDFLSRNHARYDRVMLTDVRDVIFQSDPFANIGDADIVYACERALLRDCPINTEWLRQVYGNGIYENLKDYFVSCAGTTLGTIDGILAYLTAITDEMTVSRPLDMDQGIHNYLVHMKPLRGAFLDVHDNSVATLHHMPMDSIAITGRGIEVDGRVVPVVHQWDRHASVQEYVLASARFKPRHPGGRTVSRRDGPSGRIGPARAEGSEAIICYLRPGPGTVKPGDFARYIRETGYVGVVAIIGVSFAADDREAARRYDCQLLQLDNRHATRAPDAAGHLYFHEMLSHVGADEVFLIDGIGAIFVGNPFQAKTIGVSLFAEGAKLIRDCRETTGRLSLFGEPGAHIAGRQIVSTRLLCGRRTDVQRFYGALFREYEGKQHLLETASAMQGAFNKIAWSDQRELPITVRPNGSLAYVVRWPTAMTVESEPVLRVGGAAPAVILGRDHSDDV